MENKRFQILAIDDIRENLKLLSEILSKDYYTIRVATSGKLALRSIDTEVPDLILLDIKMPEMNGYELCNILKSNNKTKDIPVIFISARDESIDKVKGFEAGGIDYITKPFEPAEVLARVRAHLKLYELQRQLESRNIELQNEIKERKRIENELIIHKTHLEEIVEERTANLKSLNEELQKEIIERKKMEEEQKALAEQLHHSQKMEAIGQLAGGIAHDFNNALASILGSADIIKLRQDLPNDIKKFASIIFSASKRAGDLTKQLLTFSRKGRKASSTIDILEIMEDTISLLKHTINKNINIQFENNAKLTTVIGDNSLLQSTLMNLGINASQAMPHGGDLQFILDNTYLDKAYCQLSPFDIKPGEYVTINIQDSGCGIPSNLINRIFEPFFTTKEKGTGTGLGLAVVYGTIQNHNGAITVYSEIDKGTVFNIYLPLSRDHKFIDDPEPEIITGSGTILIIDDEELIRITARHQLQEIGYTVLCADNGQTGLQTFQENKGSIDLIILDMIMPVLDGRLTLSKIRDIDPDIPVIISSGFTCEGDLENIKDKKISGFLHKPFRLAKLAETIHNALNKN